MRQDFEVDHLSSLFQSGDSLIFWPGDWYYHIQGKQRRRTGCIRIEGLVEGKLVLILFGMNVRGYPNEKLQQYLYVERKNNSYVSCWHEKFFQYKIS